MRQVREILRLTFPATSLAGCPAAGIVPPTVRAVVGRLRSSGLRRPLSDDISDEAPEQQLARRMSKRAEGRYRLPSSRFPTWVASGVFDADVPARRHVRCRRPAHQQFNAIDLDRLARSLNTLDAMTDKVPRSSHWLV
jgi:hypothetical protein